jgi:hypothetical protein
VKDLRGTNLFNRAQWISTDLLIGPRRQITVSKFTIEQLEVSTETMASVMSLEKPYGEGFEDLDLPQLTEISPFRPPERIELFELFNDPCHDI